MNHLKRQFGILLLLTTLWLPLGMAGNFGLLLTGVPLIESKAFADFQRRPVNELSKLLYLVDRFGKSDIEIYYDGHTYKAYLVSAVARWHLLRNYKTETVKQWIDKWCYRSTLTRERIWIHTKTGKKILAKDILLDEVSLLEKHYELALKQKEMAEETPIPEQPDADAPEAEPAPTA